MGALSGISQIACSHSKLARAVRRAEDSRPNLPILVSKPADGSIEGLPNRGAATGNVAETSHASRPARKPHRKLSRGTVFQRVHRRGDHDVANKGLAETGIGPNDADHNSRVVAQATRRTEPERVAEVDRIPACEPIQVEPPREANGIFLRETPDRTYSRTPERRRCQLLLFLAAGLH